MPAALRLCLVIAVGDGDSFTARCGAPGTRATTAVRVAAIDAPELHQAFGRQSRDHLRRLCLRRQATLQPVDEDRYGRLVARVRCHGGEDVAAAQVRAGLAWVYHPYAAQDPALPALEHRARSQKKGLWSQRRPVAPWDYRHRATR